MKGFKNIYVHYPTIKNKQNKQKAQLSPLPCDGLAIRWKAWKKIFVPYLSLILNPESNQTLVDVDSSYRDTNYRALTVFQGP